MGSFPGCARNSYPFRILPAVILGILSLLAGQPLQSQAVPTSASSYVPAEFREPVTLSTKDGVLEVRLTARQSAATLDTVAKPVQNFLLFDYELIRGTASNGQRSGKSLYPSPTLQVYPGETLIVHLDNALTGLTIADYFSPEYTSRDGKIPMYPIQLKTAPMNLHVHGLHVSPKGNADNVMLHLPAGTSNTYVYEVPKNMPQGAYWYHSHLHTLTGAETYMGLAGLLAIGRTDGNLPVVTEKKIPIRNMVLQYNGVYGRASGEAQLSNLNWPQWVSSIVPPKRDELAKGTYRPLFTPVNFAKFPKGSTFLTVWHAGELSVLNKRGQLETMPSNLQTFTPAEGSGGKVVAADPALPDHLRDVQYTVNGQFEPTIAGKGGQTEIWVLANVSDFAYIVVQLTETASGHHPKIAIVGMDGNPFSAVEYPPTDEGTRLVLPPATRAAIAVTIPKEGDLILEMPPAGGGAKAVSAPGVLYTSNETENPPAVLGTLTVEPTAYSYRDGFFTFPTQILVKATSSGGIGETTEFFEKQPLGAYTSFIDVSEQKPDVSRTIVISGGFLNNMASTSDPKAFVYAFEGGAFPNVPLLQPRLNSVEEWKFINHNNDEHPIHIHVNDFQLMEYLDPTSGLHYGPTHYGLDNVNVPAPSMNPDESVIEPGLLTVRTRFDDYAGLYVMHCHRLNHEDNGLMMMVNVIPAVSSYAVVVPGSSAAHPTEVRILDGKDDKVFATVIPFTAYTGDLNVAMGDIDGDGVLDLVVGAGKDHAPEVVAYAGARTNRGPFGTELARFHPFANTMRSGATVATAQIDGTTSDNIIVGSGPGAPSEVKVYRSAFTASGSAPALFSHFTPYPSDRSGVSLSAGFVDFATGRNSIVTAPGPGSAAQVKVFVFPLLTPIRSGSGKGTKPKPGIDDRQQPEDSASFFPFGKDYKGGVSLAVGWLAGSLGGAKRVIVSELGATGTVKVFSTGSALDGGPEMYLHNPSMHEHSAFREIASFQPFAGGAGTQVAVTSTTVGANLLVSGMSSQSQQVLKFDFVRSDPKANTLTPTSLGQVVSLTGTHPVVLAGE
jgi:FtsP/CotA-like multicopper oxidase with cupredoxin domain